MLKKAPITIALSALLLGGLFLLYQQGTFHKWFGGSQISIPKNVRFGVVDMNRVRNDSEPFKTLNSHIEERYSESNRLIFNSENELRAEDKQLREKEKLEAKGDKEHFKKRQAFMKKVTDLEQMVQQKKNTLNEQFTELTGRIEKKLQSILHDLASENGLDAILQSIADEVVVVLYYAPHLDITDRVIEELNKAKQDLNIPS